MPLLFSKLKFKFENYHGSTNACVVKLQLRYCSFHEPCKVETVNSEWLHHNSISKLVNQVHETIQINIYH